MRIMTKYHQQYLSVFYRGKYSCYFQNDEELKAWIHSEELEVLFKESLIIKGGIIPLISSLAPNESKWLSDEKEILEMLKNYNFILNNRAECVSLNE